ncbi:MAG: hypothetical protein QF391_09915, partial [Myxococcota bacterium]|nr:hypothetical protein [Myxococcota bacterium]
AASKHHGSSRAAVARMQEPHPELSVVAAPFGLSGTTRERREQAYEQRLFLREDSNLAVARRSCIETIESEAC